MVCREKQIWFSELMLIVTCQEHPAEAVETAAQVRCLVGYWTWTHLVVAFKSQNVLLFRFPNMIIFSFEHFKQL